MGSKKIAKDKELLNTVTKQNTNINAKTSFYAYKKYRDTNVGSKSMFSVMDHNSKEPVTPR